MEQSTNLNRSSRPKSVHVNIFFSCVNATRACSTRHYISLSDVQFLESHVLKHSTRSIDFPWELSPELTFTMNLVFLVFAHNFTMLAYNAKELLQFVHAIRYDNAPPAYRMLLILVPLTLIPLFADHSNFRSKLVLQLSPVLYPAPVWILTHPRLSHTF